MAVTALVANFGYFPLLAQTQQGQPGTQQQQKQTQAQAQPKPQAKPPSITGVGSAATQEDMGNVAWVAGP